MDWIIPAIAGFIFAYFMDAAFYGFITDIIATTNTSSDTQSLICLSILLLLGLASFVGTFAWVRSLFESS